MPANECSKYDETLSKDKEYRISFGDSGAGGLIFALDLLQELESKLKALESEYEVKFIFQHVGDSKNSPYGIKSSDEIRNLTKNLINYMANLSNTKTLVVACNTALTTYDSNMDKFFKKKYPNLNIITMIDESSEEIVNLATANSNDKNNIHIALLATLATIKSDVYQSKIKEMVKSNNQNLKLYTYSPQQWVKNIENGADIKVIEEVIANDMEIFKNQMGKDFTKIEVVGLFCTHYPFYKNEIKNFFIKNGNQNVKILTQGNIFSDKIYRDIKANIYNYKYNKRKLQVPQECVREIDINSDITGDNILQMKNIIDKTYSKYSELISFKKVKI